LKAFSIDIVGLGNKVHDFEFEINKSFFDHYGKELVERGSLHAKVHLDKRETMIEARFNIKGTIQLICDRSLDPYEQAVEVEKVMVFKYGHQEMELSDEIVLITRETAQLDLGQYIYEFVALEVPIKKLHPRFEQEENNTEDGLIYSSENKEEENTTDPRWDALKKLK
jgi:uncharacterized protein